MIIDDKTKVLGLKKPNKFNFMDDDINRIRDSLDQVDEQLDKLIRSGKAALGYPTTSDIRGLGVPDSTANRVILRSASTGAFISYDWVSESTDPDDDITVLNPIGNSSTKGRWVSNGIIDVTVFGVKNSAQLDDIEHNTRLVQQLLDKVGSKQCYFQIPPNCYYDWSSLNLHDYTMIIDDSGFDARAGGGAKQAYRRIISKTSKNTGATNGNTYWLTSDYHPAYISHAITSQGMPGARASFVSWIGSPSSPFQYATQWSQNFTGSNRTIEIAGYNNTADPNIATRLQTIIHPCDADNSGAHGFCAQPIDGVSYNYGLAGLPSSSTYLSKNFSKYYSAPSEWSGKFVTAHKKGSHIIWQQTIANDGSNMTYLADGSSMFSHNNDGSLSAVKRKIIKKTSPATLNKLDSRTIITNTPASGGFVITLPLATEGLEFELIVNSANNMQVQPQSADALVGWTHGAATEYKHHSAGLYCQSSIIGSRIKLICTKDGEWSYIRYGSWVDQ